MIRDFVLATLLVVVVTLISTTLFGGTGCTPKGNTTFGVGGFLLGAGIGAVL